MRFDRSTVACLTLIFVLIGSILLLITGEADVLDSGLQSRFACLDHRIFFVIISKTASLLSFSIALMAILAYGYLKHKTLEPREFALIIGSILALSLAAILKLAFARERPCGVTCTANLGYSFPSGHATRAGLLATYALDMLLAPEHETRSKSFRLLKWSFSMLAILWMILVAISRVTLGVHWTLDVIAGLALGSLSYLLAKKILATKT
jgi:membrane-associated phospholipid phosphatase